MVLTISVLPSLAALKNLFCRSWIGLSLYPVYRTWKIAPINQDEVCKLFSHCLQQITLLKLQDKTQKYFIDIGKIFWRTIWQGLIELLASRHMQSSVSDEVLLLRKPWNWQKLMVWMTNIMVEQLELLSQLSSLAWRRQSDVNAKIVGNRKNLRQKITTNWFSSQYCTDNVIEYIHNTINTSICFTILLT